MQIVSQVLIRKFHTEWFQIPLLRQAGTALDSVLSWWSLASHSVLGLLFLFNSIGQACFYFQINGINSEYIKVNNS